MTSTKKTMNFIKEFDMKVRPSIDSLSNAKVNVPLPDRYAKFLGESPYYLNVTNNELDQVNMYSVNKLKEEEKHNFLNKLSVEEGHTFAELLAQHNKPKEIKEPVVDPNYEKKLMI